MGALDGWGLTTVKFDDGHVEFHNHPIGDLREHDLDGLECWCRPTLDSESNGLLTVHNSADRREEYEVMDQ
jgi:hypothetical protein